MDNNDGAPARRNIRRIIIKASIGICILLGVSLVVSGFVLKQRIHVKDLTTGTTSISGSSLVWKDKLELEVDTVQPAWAGESFAAKSIYHYPEVKLCAVYCF